MSKNVSQERMQILEMVEEGKINTKDAMELLDALERNTELIKPKTDAKWLKIRVRTMDDNPKVNVNIPISLVEAGLKLAKKFDPKLEESGRDQIDLDEIIEAVKNGAEGKLVDVEDEENQTKVQIFVE
jgi:polyhydroxyalkanoate synthesis regulator phasin